MKFKSNFFFVIICILLSSCAEIYSPTSPNIEKIDKKYELHGGVNLSTSGLNFKTAFSPLSHVCVQYNGIIGTGNHGTEFAIGAYNFFSNIGYHQLTFGYGTGKSDFSDPMTGSDFSLSSAKGDYTKKFAQIYFSVNGNNRKLHGFCIRLEEVRIKYSDCNLNYFIGNTYVVHYMEPYYVLQIEMSKHSCFMFYGGIILNSQSMEIKTNYLNLGFGIAIKFFSENKNVSD